MVDKILPKGEGVTHDIWKEEEPAEGGEGEAAEEGEGGDNDATEEEAEELPKSIYIKEVCREPRMKYYDVPKLGSYMAIELTYESCL